MSVTVTNTDANLSAKTLVVAENAQTVTGLQTFDRDPNPPFAVTSGSSSVANLDADKVDGKHSTDILLLDGTQSMAAALNLGAAGQLVFPATQNASAGANTLDDYEEGTFTPTIVSSGGGTPTYTTQAGKYVKVGKLVQYWARITLATKGTLGVGNVLVGALPFTSDSTATNLGNCQVTFWGGMTTSVTSLSGFVQSSDTQVSMRYVAGVATSISTLTVADVSATFDIIFAGSYLASA